MEALESSSLEQIALHEAIKLGAVDGSFFARTFFPNTVRQAPPLFDKEVWEALDNPLFRYMQALIFRGGAKTTRLRLFTAKRIAYNVSRTILYVGASEGHAARSIQWLRRAVEFNKLYAGTFGLRPGRKWQETEIEIFHGVDEQPIWVLGVGITGNIRGINFDDYRPDLIVLDDILTDENAATLEQREKVANLLFGALKDSLTPATEEPNAKMVMLVTPQHVQDVSSMAKQDPQFKSLIYGCWTPETSELPTEKQESSWPSRYPTATLREDKEAAIKRNRLSIFMREMECKLVSVESCSFRSEWLQFYEEKPKGLYCVVSIDPVPPPSERQMQKQLKGKDFEGLTVWGRQGPDYFLLDEDENRGHEPNYTVAKVLEYCMMYRPAAVVVEAVGYQRVLKGLLETEMARRKFYVPVIPYVDTRAKFTRIVTTFQGIAAAGHVWVHPSQSRFITQFTNYGPTYTDHDDVIDSSAIGLSQIINPYLEDATGGRLDNSNVVAIGGFRRAP